MTALERKHRSESILKSLNIPFIDHLPKIEEEKDAKVRKPQEIAIRILILANLCLVAEDENTRLEVITFLKREKLWSSVSKFEKELFRKKLTKKEKNNIAWRSEAIWMLLWAIYKVETLELPDRETHIDEIMERIPPFMESTKEFIETSAVRPITEILDIADLTYRLHWTTKHTQLNSLDKLNLNPSIVYERHYAINWITFYDDNWDDISTDT